MDLGTQPILVEVRLTTGETVLAPHSEEGARDVIKAVAALPPGASSFPGDAAVEAEDRLVHVLLPWALWISGRVLGHLVLLGEHGTAWAIPLAAIAAIKATDSRFTEPIPEADVRSIGFRFPS